MLVAEVPGSRVYSLRHVDRVVVHGSVAAVGRIVHEIRDLPAGPVRVISPKLVEAVERTRVGHDADGRPAPPRGRSVVAAPVVPSRIHEIGEGGGGYVQPVEARIDGSKRVVVEVRQGPAHHLHVVSGGLPEGRVSDGYLGGIGTLDQEGGVGAAVVVEGSTVGVKHTGAGILMEAEEMEPELPGW